MGVISLFLATFGDRLKEAYGTQEVAALSRRLGVTYQAAKNYVDGRLPSPEKLIEISNSTGCSIDWLLTGKAPSEKQQVAKAPIADPLINRDAFASMVRDIVRDELRSMQPVQDLGTVDEFDIDAAVEKYDNAVPVLKDWYAHDNLPFPEGLEQSLAFSRWDKLSHESKVREIKRVRQNIEEDQYFEDRRISQIPKHTKKI